MTRRPFLCMGHITLNMAGLRKHTAPGGGVGGRILRRLHNLVLHLDLVSGSLQLVDPGSFSLVWLMPPQTRKEGKGQRVVSHHWTVDCVFMFSQLFGSSKAEKGHPSLQVTLTVLQAMKCLR